MVSTGDSSVGDFCKSTPRFRNSSTIRFGHREQCIPSIRRDTVLSESRDASFVVPGSSFGLFRRFELRPDCTSISCASYPASSIASTSCLENSWLSSARKWTLALCPMRDTSARSTPGKSSAFVTLPTQELQVMPSTDRVATKSGVLYTDSAATCSSPPPWVFEAAHIWQLVSCSSRVVSSTSECCCGAHR